MYIDVHAHLDPYFFTEEQIAQAVKNAENNNVKIIIANGLNKETNRHALALAKKYPQIKAALGIYPWEAMMDDVKAGFYKKESIDFDVDEEIAFIKKHKNDIAAIGEVGIDQKNAHTTRKQFEIFEKIINLSKEIEKPLIIHSRKAEAEVIDLLEKHQVKKVVMHCFSGKKVLWQKIRDNKWYCSIPTNCVRSEHFQELIKFLPITQLFGETDSPFLGPVKDAKNEPVNVVETYKMIAAIKKMELKEVRPEQHWTEPPARYSEATLIKTLEEKGIGRPSTYAPTISVIQTRNYVVKEDRRFKPTEMGELVNKVLTENFSEIIDVDFTAKMEDSLDAVADGKEQWQDLLGAFYGPFSKNLEEKYAEVKKQTPVEETGEMCEKCGKPMVIRMSRFGKFIACSGFPNCRNTKKMTGVAGHPEALAEGSNNPPIDMKCPKCKDGNVVVRRTKKRGKIFWGCSAYPKCDWASWENPSASSGQAPSTDSGRALLKEKGVEETEPTEPIEKE